MLVEALIVLPFLFLLLLALFDGYRLGQAKLGLNQIAREALLGASTFTPPGAPVVAPNSVTETEVATCLNATLSDCRERIALWRVKQLIASANLPIKVDTVQVVITDLGYVGGHSFTIAVEAAYDGYSPFFKLAKVKTTVQGDQLS